MTLRELLERHGVNGYALGEEVGIVPSTIFRYLDSSIDRMPLCTAIKLTSGLNITLDEFYYRLAAARPDALEGDGWHVLSNGFEVFTKDGTILKGRNGKQVVYPYLPARGGGYTNVAGTSIENIDLLEWF